LSKPADQQKTQHKIKTLDELSPVVDRLKKSGKKVAHCHGVFDLMHPGHIRHLQSARQTADVLVVTLTPDRFVNKGPGRPAFNEELRAEVVAALQFVDYVAINNWATAVETIGLLKPNVYVKGAEYANDKNDLTGKILDEEHAVKAVGGRIHFTNDVVFSSSKLINSYLSNYPPETEAWLAGFRERHSAEELLKTINRVADIKVLVLGEAIIDEYCFCDGLGKATKDPILAFLYRSIESYAGGSLAVANHLAAFCKEISFATYLGSQDRREEFVREALRPNVGAHFLTRDNAPTIHKRRFVDSHTNARLFELYKMDDTPASPEEEARMMDTIDPLLDESDLVIVMDYGHGMFSPRIIQKLCDRAKFLAVNVQANAGNRGFNTISRYPRADYVCLAGHEIALEARLKHAPLPELILEVGKKVHCSRFTVTAGKSGSIHYEKGQEFVYVPALATHVTDRVGAGDAVMAVTSLLVNQGLPWEVVGFMGNLAGAQMVADLGNRTVLDKVSFSKYVVSVMK
jgi:rfaE bifunctional protein kinase chain/domain/rfaE bifunctional protein nucleotidyltransferase chain/domain